MKTDLVRSTVLPGFVLALMLAPGDVCAQRWDNAWKAPHRLLAAPEAVELGDTNELVRPCIDEARAKFSGASGLFQAGLPKGGYFVVVVGQSDPYDSNDHEWVWVDSVKDSRIKGRESNEAHERLRKRVTISADQVADWAIVFPDRPELGNLLRKHALLRQDGLVPDSCDPQRPEMQDFRLFRHTYSFIPPTGARWQLRGAHVTSDGTTYVDMWMQEWGSGPSELNTLATETLGNANEFETTQELVDLITELEAAGYVETERHVPLEQEVTAYEGLGAMCALSHRSARDNFALLSSSGERGPMIREILELGCVHPVTNEIYIQMTYSHRYKPDHRDPGFVERAHAVFRSLAFSSFEFDGDYSKLR